MGGNKDNVKINSIIVRKIFVKENKGAVRRQDDNSLLALHCLTSDHAFDWDRATVVGNGMSKYKREFVEAWNTASTCVNQSMNLDPGYKALREYWRR